MFALTNGRVQLRPYKVTYSRTFGKVITEGYFDEETQEYVRPVIENETQEACCCFEDSGVAAAYAEEVNGEVLDLTPSAEIVEALPRMTFTSVEEVKAFIENGVEPAISELDATQMALVEVYEKLLEVSHNGWDLRGFDFKRPKDD